MTTIVSNREQQRTGVLVEPHRRLSDAQVRLVDETSRELLEDPGVLSRNPQVIDVFRHAGAKTEEDGDWTRIRISSALLDKALDSAPSTIVLGAREPGNRLILDAHEPRVRFGSGSETNIWLEVSFEDGRPTFTRRPGSIDYLARAAHLCDQLDNCDFFIRCVNIQDEDVTTANKDVNKYGVSLNNITKHVMAGLSDLAALDDVLQLGRIVAGGDDAFVENPVVSFIACVLKSPLQFVDDTADTFIEVAKRRAPIVVSSCPMGGATGAFDEFGMVAQINAELLAGVCLNQFVAPGAPILYGAVPVRTRLDNLNDMYGAPEFVQYNMDCAQMARFYGLPCYSTAGVGDVDRPGIQATVEKMLTYATVPMAGAQYIHYAFGLLDRTSIFCPEQAVLDDAHIGLVKHMLAPTDVTPENKTGVLEKLREIMKTDHKSFVYNLPIPAYDPVYVRYPLEHPDDALRAAHDRYHEIMELPRNPLPAEVREEIMAKVPGVLPRALAAEGAAS